jgi:alpha-glucoside transport system substrate-binding protein
MGHFSTGPRLRSMALGVGAVLLLVGCGGGGGGTGSSGSSSDVTVWVAWGGQELKAFKDVVKPFESQNNIKVHITTTRSGDLQEADNVAAGTSLPDIGVIPTIDKAQSWAEKGIMKPLESYMGDKMSDYMNNTYKSLTTPASGDTDLTIGVVHGKHYYAWVKTQVKGLFWYNPKVFTGGSSPPKTFDDLLAIKPPAGTKLFCQGLSSGDASGWPAVDMIDNIVMRQSGPKVYLDWMNGKQKWSSPEIKSAYQALGKLLSPANTYGGSNNVLSTPFSEAQRPLFSNPPGCLFLEQATFEENFIVQDNASAKAGTDFDAFAHPSLNSQYDGTVNWFGDSMVMFNQSPAATKFMQYVTSAQAQQIWVNDGGTLAANKTVTNYPDPVLKKAAQVEADAKTLLVTAGDFMPADMQHAFRASMLDFVKDQSKLTSILAHLDQVQASAYTP